MGRDEGSRLAEILIVEVGGRRFGLPAGEVQELLRMVALAPVPGAGAVEGAMNLRGRVVPVLDIRAGLGLPAKPIEPEDHLVVARLGGRPVAVRVDRALELARPAPGEVEAVDGLMSDGQGVGRMMKRPEGLVPVLDLRGLFGTEEGRGP